MLLQDRIAIVTGGAQGLGLAIATRFVEQGATVVLADLDADAADAAAADLSGDRAHGAACDVTSESDVQDLFDATIAAHGRVDVLVNNAGITRDAVAHKMTLEQFRQVIDVHLQGTWLGTRAALTHMRGREGGGAIVNLSSLSGKIGNLGQTNYSAAKAGIVGMTKASAKEGARYGIRANAIQPGLIRTAMTDAMPQDVVADR
ncbi:MAG: SDR family NAD(P)-dependent oxidoreductase, partial [Nitriliruptor sp.]|uniref:SDR family oxidoreductase n=1 Tax=Nitriliruptor sp. TaxID=2448056 RepID=UPI0034A02F20